MRRVPTFSTSLSTAALTFALALSLAMAPGVAVAKAPAAKSPAAAEPAVDPALFQGMKWRNIGPFRGGRATAVAGVAQDPLTYYFGSSGGGVWKTEDAGTTWKNVSDGFFKTGSVGALAVAPSDPNVVYAGMGEAPVRGVTTSHGDGVYRSTDAGRTWTHLGLDATEHVSAIAVDPRNPDVVFVAAQGSAWKPTPERGVYRSTDGGATWKLVLHVSDSAGASDLSMDPTNPRVIYAAFWDHQRTPWQIRSGGPGSGVWKTTDGGNTWERLGRGESGDQGGHGGSGEQGGAAGHGGRLPDLMGKVGVAVSLARPERVWAMVEADDGGLFRSDDAGKTWHRVNKERELRARAWYYTDVFADPVDPDTVWVLNAPILRSTDGGRTFHRVRQAHGDNHDLWINPKHPRYLVEANDGGAIVSTNGGETWSTENNQPTAQFYRVDTDDTFPFRVYGGQQDNSTVAIASAAPGGIGRQDWFQVGGCESAHVAFDPKDPKLVYAGCYQGMISEYDVANERERQITAEPFLGLGADPDQQPYRFNWNAPIEVSPEDPSVIYHGGNVLFETKDRGTHWRVISPDLTRDEKSKQGPGGAPITNESAGGEVYGTIFALAPSPHDAGTIWVGSDDGLVHLTRDGGEHWTDVTPPDVARLGEAQINAIDVSPHQAGKAYVAVTRYKLGDYRPLAFKTEDYGATWTKITDGIPDGHWVRVVREDPVRAGLLYAGTEHGAYVSFDDGGHWQSLQLNLPVVPVTDLQVRQGDLVASTQGRAFWILDDLAPLRQADAEAASAALYLYTPAEATRAEWGGGFGGGGGRAVGANPPSGAVIDYVLSKDLAAALSAHPAKPEKDGAGAKASDPKSSADPTPADGMAAEAKPEAGAAEAPGHKAGPKLELEIRDAEGKVVRTLSSVPKKRNGGSPGGGGEEGGPFGERPELLSTKAGMSRIVWDLRADSLTKVPGQVVFGSFDGPRLPPGTYTRELRAHTSRGDQEATRTLKVIEDPRIETTAAGYTEEQAVLARVRDTLDELDRSVLRERKVRDQVQQAVDRLDDVPGSEEIAKSGKDLVQALGDWEKQVVQTKVTNFQDIINFPNRLDGQIAYLYSMVDSSGPPVTAGAAKRADDLAGQWAEKKAALDTLLGQRVAAFNQLMEQHKVPAVVVPPEKEQKQEKEASE